MSTLSKIDEYFQAEALKAKIEAAEHLYEDLVDSPPTLLKIHRIDTHIKALEDQKELLEFLKDQVEQKLDPTDKDKLERIRGSEEYGSRNGFKVEAKVRRRF